MFFLFLFINKIYGESGDVIEVKNRLDKIFEDDSEINDLYKEHKNTGYYIFETPRNEFWAKDIRIFYDDLINPNNLMELDEFQIYIDDFKVDFEPSTFLSDIKKTIDENNDYMECKKFEDLENIKENQLYKFKRNLLNLINKKYVENFSNNEIKKPLYNNKILILSNSKIDDHLMMIAYKTLSKRLSSFMGDSVNDSLFVFLSLRFSEVNGKDDFKNKIADMNFKTKKNEMDVNLLRNFGLYGSFSKIGTDIKFDIKKIYESQCLKSMDGDEFKCLSSILEMFQTEKILGQDLVSKRVSFLIKRINCTLDQLNEIFRVDKAERVVYEIKNYIFDKKEEEEKTLIIIFDTINGESEINNRFRIKVFLSGNMIIDCFKFENDPKEHDSLKISERRKYLRKSLISTYKKELLEHTVVSNNIILKKLKDIIYLLKLKGINPYIASLPSIKSFYQSNNLIFIGHEPLSFKYTFHKSVSINDAIEKLAEKSLACGQKHLNGYKNMIYTYDYESIKSFQLCGGFICDKYYGPSNFKEKIKKYTAIFKQVSNKNFKRDASIMNTEPCLFSLEHPNDISKSKFFYLDIEYLYCELFKNTFNEKIKSLINNVSCSENNENGLNLKLFNSENPNIQLDVLKSKLCQFFDMDIMKENVFIYSKIFDDSITDESSDLIKTFFETLSPIINVDFLNNKKLNMMVWLKEIIKDVYDKTEIDIANKKEFNNIVIKVYIFTAEPYVPDVLYSIKDSILSDDQL